jgi:hypothetical protein
MNRLQIPGLSIRGSDREYVPVFLKKILKNLKSQLQGRRKEGCTKKAG